MRELTLLQRLGNDSRDAPAGGQHRIGQPAHQARVRPAAHQLDVSLSQERAERFGCGAVHLARSEARTAEHEGAWPEDGGHDARSKLSAGQRCARAA
jgi:hypothetical protein